MQTLDELFPKSEIVKPSIKSMRRNGIFVAQHVDKAECYWTDKGIPVMVKYLNNHVCGRLKVCKQCLYQCAWGTRTLHRGFTVRYIPETDFEKLTSGLQMVKCQ